MEDMVAFNTTKSEEEPEDFNKNPANNDAKYNRMTAAQNSSTVINFLPNRHRRQSRQQPVSPIDEKNCFDIIISCGFGAKAYTMGSKFANPRFRVRFASKLYYVLLVQLLLCILWMSYVPSSPNLNQLDGVTRGVVATAIIFYVVLFTITRCSTCEGMCLLGHMIITIVMTICLAIICGGLFVIFPPWIFITAAVWLTLAFLALTNWNERTNVLTGNAYAVATCGSLLSSSVILLSGWFLCLPVPISQPSLYETIAAVSLLTPLLSLFLVNEVKKLIGGRRANLEGHEWILAAIII
jgi:hypothetical protein